VYQAL